MYMPAVRANTCKLFKHLVNKTMELVTLAALQLLELCHST